MRFHVVTARGTEADAQIAAAVRALGVDAGLLRPERLRSAARRGDTVLGRVDVLPTLDGVEACIWHLRRLERVGAHVLNGTGALLAAHDKLITAVRLARAGLDHPRTVHVDGTPLHELEPPLVLKPRFGSWGRDVVLCESPADVVRQLRRLRSRPWFRRHGVLAQEYVPNNGRDLRVLVASGAVVGAIERVAAPGEWRTNVALGATRRRTQPPREACEVAVRTAAALGADFVGVDLVRDRDGRFVPLEVNGAVDFTADYSLGGGDVFLDVASKLLSTDRGTLSCAVA